MPEQARKIISLPTDRRRIKLTADDMKHGRMMSIRSIVKPSDENIPLLPPLSEAPEIYHICENCGIIDPMWSSLLKRWVKRTCPCKKQERQDLERKEIEEAWFHWQIVNCYGGWLGRNYKDEATAYKMAGKTFNSYMVAPGDTAYSRARQYADSPKGNMIFCGSYGTGKTHLGAAILNHRRDAYRDTTLFVSAPQFFRAYEDARRNFDPTDFQSINQKIIQAKALYLDDIDKEWRGEYKQPEQLYSVYYYVFDERYKARRPTIVSTNEIDQLEKFIGPAAKSRLMSKCQVIEMVGEDFRPMEEDW